MRLLETHELGGGVDNKRIMYYLLLNAAAASDLLIQAVISG